MAFDCPRLFLNCDLNKFTFINTKGRLSWGSFHNFLKFIIRQLIYPISITFIPSHPPKQLMFTKIKKACPQMNIFQENNKCCLYKSYGRCERADIYSNSEITEKSKILRDGETHNFLDPRPPGLIVRWYFTQYQVLLHLVSNL